MSGPAPKHPSVRRRNNPGKQATVAPATGGAQAPPTPEGLHTEAAAWYDSLSASAQATLYEPSDWAQAVIGSRLLSDWLENQRSTSMAAWLKIADRLVSTEQARRQALIETAPKKPLQSVTPEPASTRYKRALGVVPDPDASGQSLPDSGHAPLG